MPSSCCSESGTDYNRYHLRCNNCFRTSKFLCGLAQAYGLQNEPYAVIHRVEIRRVGRPFCCHSCVALVLRAGAESRWSVHCCFPKWRPGPKSHHGVQGVSVVNVLSILTPSSTKTRGISPVAHRCGRALEPFDGPPGIPAILMPSLGHCNTKFFMSRWLGIF